MTTTTKSSDRRIPIRTCVSCGEKSAKLNLARIVSTQDGSLKVDTSGRLPGRGAYICINRNKKCSVENMNKSQLEYALRRGITDAEWIAVKSFSSHIYTQK